MVLTAHSSPHSAQYLSQETECQDTDAKGVQVIVDALLELVSDLILNSKPKILNPYLFNFEKAQ